MLVISTQDTEKDKSPWNLLTNICRPFGEFQACWEIHLKQQKQTNKNQKNKQSSSCGD